MTRRDAPTGLSVAPCPGFAVLRHRRGIARANQWVIEGGLGVSRMWGDGDAGDMTGRSVAGWGIVDGVGLALG
jgi:hypothetical protein